MYGGHSAKTVAASRPLSPHLTIYRWPVTMADLDHPSGHRHGAAVGAIVLAWWLVSHLQRAGRLESFMAYAATPLGLLVLFGLTWSLVFHFLNGMRHLAWDLGYGFDKHAAERNSVIWSSRFPSSVAVAVFALVWTGHGGYLQ